MRFARRNLATTYAAFAVAIASALVLTPIVVGHLGKEAYGVWAFAGSAVALLGLIDLGVGIAVVRAAAEQRGRGDEEETNALAATGLALYSGLAVGAVALGAALAWLVPVLVDVPDELARAARLTTLVLAAGVAVQLPLGLFSNLLRAQQRFDVINGSIVIVTILYTALVPLALVVGGGGLVALAAISLLATVLRLVLPLPWVRRELPSLRLARRDVTRRRVRRLLAISWHNFLIQISTKVVLSADVIVVGVVLGAAAATLYAIPARLFTLGVQLGTAGLAMLLPAFAEAEGAGEAVRQRALLRLGLRIGMAMVAVVAVPLAVIPGQLIDAWLDVPGFGPSATVMTLLALALVVRQPAYVLGQYLLGRGEQRVLAIVSTSSVAANVVLSVVLAKTVGLWGVAAATLATDAVAGLVVLPLVAARRGALSPRTVAAASLRPLVPVALLGGLLLVVVHALEPHGRLAYSAVGLGWIAAAAVATWFVGLNGSERRAVRATAFPRGAARVAAAGAE